MATKNHNMRKKILENIRLFCFFTFGFCLSHHIRLYHVSIGTPSKARRMWQIPVGKNVVVFCYPKIFKIYSYGVLPYAHMFCWQRIVKTLSCNWCSEIDWIELLSMICTGTSIVHEIIHRSVSTSDVPMQSMRAVALQTSQPTCSKSLAVHIHPSRTGKSTRNDRKRTKHIIVSLLSG